MQSDWFSLHPAGPGAPDAGTSVALARSALRLLARFEDWSRGRGPVVGDQERKIAALARFVVRDRSIGNPVERLEHTVTLLQPSSMVRPGMPGACTEGRSRRYFGKRWGERARFRAFEGCRRGCACTTLLRGWPR